MTVEPDDPATIRAGPRYEAVRAVLTAAEAALDAPLEDAEVEVGWTEATRVAVLDEVREVMARLSAGERATVVSPEWRGLDPDAIDAESGTPLTEAILDIDVVLGDLERAEAALAEAIALRGALAAPITPTDRDDGFDEAVRDELVGLIDEIRAALASGQVLTIELMDDWADALRALGYRRAVPRPGFDDDAVAVGFTQQRIEQFVPGARFEAVALFDGWLYNIGFTDTLAVRDGADGWGEGPAGLEVAEDGAD